MKPITIFSTLTIILSLSLFSMSSCTKKDSAEVDPGANPERIAYLQSLYDEFAPIKVDANISHLTERERLMLAKLAEAGKILDNLF